MRFLETSTTLDAYKRDKTNGFVPVLPHNTIYNMSVNQKVVKEGVLFKQGSGCGIFKLKNWKMRHFVLTYDEIHYFSGYTQKGSMSLRLCTPDSIEIMPDSDRRGGGTMWRIAITTHTRRLLIACANEDDMEAWIDAFNHVIQYNIKRKQRSTCKIALSHEASFLDNESSISSECPTYRNS